MDSVSESLPEKQEFYWLGPDVISIGKLSSGAAAEMAGVPRVMFLNLCADYNIPISQITPEELQREVDNSETQAG